MAWTEVCKINFKATCDGLMANRKVSVSKILRQLSDESGIPLRTLQRWWFEMKMKEENSAKNGANDECTENNNKNEDEKTDGAQTEKKWICRACGKSDVSPALNGSGKPYGPKSRFYNVCLPCKRKAQHTIKDGEGMETVCPECGTGHKIPWTTIESRLNQFKKMGGNENG